MSDILSLNGNPLRDNLAVHFPVSSGDPVYPEKKSNVVIKTDGTMEYGSVENTVGKIDPDVFTTSMKYKASDGTIQNASNVARTLSWIPKNADSIKVDSTGYVTGIELLAWNSSGTYIGVWDAANQTFITSAEKFGTEIDLKKAFAVDSSYKFKLSFTITGSITAVDARKHILWVNTDYDLTKRTAEDDNGILMFDTSGITVVQNVYIVGAQGVESPDTNYVSTDYIDISKRINNTIEFNGSIVSNPIGFSVYDKGKNWIDGLWGNKTDRESLGYLSDNCPQHFTWTLPKNACYLRISMRKDYYSSASDFNVKFLMTNKSNVADETYYDTNFVSIGHKGYGFPSSADTLHAFIGAAEAGFSAVEIDCRKTADGVYVVSHNDTNTLYSNGTSSSVTISESNWSDMKGKTVDSAGQYPLCTLAQVFNTLKRYKVRYYIIDLKAGSNAEIMKLARRCGVASQIMLSYYSQQSLLDDLTLIAEYPNVSVRFTPSLTKTAFETVKAAVKNELYADINITDGGLTYYPRALSLQLPILFSGVTSENKNAMAGIAAGAMANTTLQFSPYDFANMIKLDLNQFPTLSTETESVSVSTGSNATVTVTSDTNDPACYVFGYSDNLDVCEVLPNGYGTNVTFTVTKAGTGTANLIVFTPTGEQLVIPVNAS